MSTTIATPAAVQAPPRSAVIEAIFRLLADRSIQIGSKVFEQDITDKVGRALGTSISRTPVREALAVLASDGFVVQRPQVGCWFRVVAPDEIEDLISLRQGIEAKVVRRLAESSARVSDEIDAANGRVFEAKRRGSRDDVLAADNYFHVALAWVAAPAAAPTIRTWGDKLRVFWASQDDAAGLDADRVIADHEALLQHIGQHDAGGAVTLIEDHLDALARLTTG